MVHGFRVGYLSSIVLICVLHIRENTTPSLTDSTGRFPYAQCQEAAEKVLESTAVRIGTSPLKLRENVLLAHPLHDNGSGVGGNIPVGQRVCAVPKKATRICGGGGNTGGWRMKPAGMISIMQ